MTGTGFFEQKTVRPGGLALVVCMHAAVFAALVLVKTSVEAGVLPITRVFDVPMPQPKEETPPDPPREQPRQRPGNGRPAAADRPRRDPRPPPRRRRLTPRLAPASLTRPSPGTFRYSIT